MTKTAHESSSPREGVELGYEPEAVRARGFLIFGILFVLAAAGIHILVWFTMRTMESRNAKDDLPSSILRADQQPPAPNLQPSVGHYSSDAEDMEALRNKEDDVFRKLGWNVNPGTHQAEIPADIVQRVAADARLRAAAPVPSTTTGGEANSIMPGPIPSGSLRPGVRGGQQ